MLGKPNFRSPFIASCAIMALNQTFPQGGQLMKQYFAKSLLLPVLAVIFLVCALVLTPSDAFAAEPQNASSMTAKEFQSYKPVIQSIQSLRELEPNLHLPLPDLAYYALTLKNPLEGAYPELIYSTSKNGTYQLMDSYLPEEIGYKYDAYPTIRNEQYRNLYVKICYYTYIDGKKCFTQFSEPFKASSVLPDVPDPYIRMYRQSGLIFVDFHKTDGFTRSLQIREKGASKWVSVSKSKLVKKVKTTKDGYTLTLNTDKSYEVRGRQYATINGEKVYSDYRTAKTFSNPSKIKNISFLRYDKDNKTAIRFGSPYVDDYSGYQIAYRKAGSADTWKKVTLTSNDTKEAIVSVYQTTTWWDAKNGYEYKIRPYTIVAGKKFYGYYSNVYTCTKKNSAFVNEIDPGYFDYFTRSDITEEERPSYDHSLTIKENYNVIQQFVSTPYLRLFHSGMGHNDSGPFAGSRVEYSSRASEGLVGIQILGRMDDNAGAMTLELLRFFTEDDEVANGFFCWMQAVQSFGHANSDYFGFRDVKETSNGFIIEMNGQEIIVEHTNQGTIYWFDVN